VKQFLGAIAPGCVLRALDADRFGWAFLFGDNL
jgi:hypothetical protein